MSTGASRSTRRNTMPLSIGAGRRVILTFWPVCRPTPEALTSDLRVRCRSIDKCLWKLQFYARDGRGAPARMGAPPAPSVRLFAQERGNVVLIHSRLLQRLDSGSTVASNYRRRIELVVIDRAGQVVGPRLLRHHELRLGLPRSRWSPQAGRHHGNAQVLGKRVVIDAAVND